MGNVVAVTVEVWVEQVGPKESPEKSIAVAVGKHLVGTAPGGKMLWANGGTGAKEQTAYRVTRAAVTVGKVRAIVRAEGTEGASDGASTDDPGR